VIRVGPILATSTIVRPTSTAAEIAMLSTRRPQPLPTVYVVARIAFSLGVGSWPSWC
jgi:hypothetical protein